LKGTESIQRYSTMISSAARRTLALNKASLGKSVQIRLVSSMPPPTPTSPVKKDHESNKKERREMHNSARREADTAAAPVAVKAVTTNSKSKSSQTLMDRFVVTAEVTVSKIFPAGFGWQSGSVIADSHFGYASDSLNFALTTGVGDGVGVVMGHYAYYTAKKLITGTSDIDLTKELHTGILLGSAAFCSGTAWQPLVNALQGANVPFSQVFVGTWLGCGAAFYVGLRLGRTILSGPLAHVQEPTYENSKADVSLSAAIGGATGFFVGTDVAYLPDQNFLLDFVGIQDGTPDLKGAAIAGASTSLGFMSAQSGMNLIYPKGKCWNDN
jgi:hypothetical protein